MSGHQYKFFISPVIIFSLVFSSFAFIPTKKADAVAIDSGAATRAVAAIALTCLLQGLLPSLAQVTQVPVTDKTANNKACTLDAVFNTMAKVLLSSITESIVDWAQNGFPDGGPAFAKNLNRTMKNMAEGEIANFLSVLTGVNICDPSFLRLLIKVNQPRKSVDAKYSCTLTIAKEKMSEFYNDFSKGGWLTYEQSLADQNNPGGFLVSGSSDIAGQVSQKQVNVLQELGWGNGFFNYKDASGNTLTPNAAVKTQLDNSLNSSTLELQLAHSFDQVVVAIMNALVQKAFNDAKGFFN